LKNKLKAKGLGGDAQVIECLPSKHKVPNSILSTTKKKRRKGTLLPKGGLGNGRGGKQKGELRLVSLKD
jgi:hypothetical protein